MASAVEALRRIYGDLVWRRARVRIATPVDPKLDSEPIFLIGIYRSGTTLLRYVIDSHSSIACPPESEFLVHLHSLASDPRSLAGLDSLGYDHEHLVQRLRLFAAYFFEGYAASRQKPRWADKSPIYVDHLDFLAELFPTAKFVVLHRHPLDQIHSACRGGKYRPAALSNSSGQDVRVDLAGYWSGKTRLLVDFTTREARRCHVLRYEDLCLDPKATLGPVFEFLSEAWEEQVLEFYRFEHDRGHEDGRVGATRGFSISTRNYLRWPPELVEQCLRIVETEMRAVGYEFGGAMP